MASGRQRCPRHAAGSLGGDRFRHDPHVRGLRRKQHRSFRGDEPVRTGAGPYGSRAASAINAGFQQGDAWTPNVVIEWGAGWQTYTGWPFGNDTTTGAGRVAQADFNAGGAALDVTFTPDAGFGVLVKSFAFTVWNGSPESLCRSAGHCSAARRSRPACSPPARRMPLARRAARRRFPPDCRRSIPGACRSSFAGNGSAATGPSSRSTISISFRRRRGSRRNLPGQRPTPS